MQDQKTLIEIINRINKSKSSIVIAHQNPDGDSLGSMISVGKILEQKGHSVDYVVPDLIPEAYRFLPYSKLLKIPANENFRSQYDMAFSLDCGSIKRLGKAVDLWNRAAIKVNIDHHISNERFGDLNWIEPEAVSTGLIVYWLAKKTCTSITREIATLFYVTLLTDTGCFSNSNTDKNALNWGAELLELGAEHLDVYRKIFLEKPFRTVKIFGHGLSKIELFEENKVAFTCVDREVMDKLSGTSEDTEDIVDYMKRIKGVKVCILLREDHNEIKVSLRSNSDFDVSKIALSLGGGGHKKAAGINLKKSLSEAKTLILKTITEELKNQLTPGLKL